MAQEVLQLKTASKKQVQLSAEQLSNWTSTVTLGRFGLRNAEDVIKFLNSPAGETVKAEIGAELALIAAIQEERRIEIQDEQLFHRRLLAFLLLSLLAYREAKAQAVNEEIMEQIDKRLHQTPHSEAKSSSAYDQAVNDILEAYEAELKYLQEEQKLYEKDEEDLAKDLEEHQLQLSDLQTKHDIYNQVLSDLETEFSQLEADLAIAAPLPLTQEQDRAKNEAITKLQGELDKIATEISKKTNQITTLIAEGKEKEVKTALHELDGLHFREAFLTDLLEVSQYKKHLFDANGELTNSLTKADFVLKRDKKIVEHEGQYYLINADQDIHALNEGEKDIAAKEYQKSKGADVSVKKMVIDNMEFEREHYDKKSDSLEERGKQINEYKTLINNQLNQVQAALSIVRQRLENPESLMDSPSPALSRRPSVTPVPTVVPSHSYRKVTEFLHGNNAKKITRDQLYQFNKNLPPKQQYLINNALTAIPINAPIPHITMIMMLRHLERFGVDATPVMTNISNPREQQALAASELPQEKEKKAQQQQDLTPQDEPKKEYPNPFKMTPYKH
ncbi:hypothetical protein FOG18_10055 [Legionella israelensis]|uniref:hypothetical protein n=1 Tax=Legionella israelensis TaxID=454 RepID=UPI00117F5627|nr:hypothetical protein [Legionella israelensis]QDP72878.1 hypothetical protein FOG18_10055 [Legionella israelensis]